MCPGCDRSLDGRRRFASQKLCNACQRWQERNPGKPLSMRTRRMLTPIPRTVIPNGSIAADPRWRKLARCREADPSLFEYRDGPIDDDLIMVAEVFCAECPVLAQCRADAAAAPEFALGIRGGEYRAFRSLRRPTDLLTRREVLRERSEAAREAAAVPIAS